MSLKRVVRHFISWFWIDLIPVSWWKNIANLLWLCPEETYPSAPWFPHMTLKSQMKSINQLALPAFLLFGPVRLLTCNDVTAHRSGIASCLPVQEAIIVPRLDCLLFFQFLISCTSATTLASTAANRLWSLTHLLAGSCLIFGELDFWLIFLGRRLPFWSWRRRDWEHALCSWDFLKRARHLFHLRAHYSQLVFESNIDSSVLFNFQTPVLNE